MQEIMELSQVLPIEEIVKLGKKEGLKYFKSVNKYFSIQDLCKHWKTSSATFYSKFAPEIGYGKRVKAKKANLVSASNTSKLKKDLNTNIEAKKTDNLVSKKKVEDNIDKILDTNDIERETPTLEQIFKINNCRDLGKIKEILSTINTFETNGHYYDIELKMVQR